MYQMAHLYIMAKSDDPGLFKIGRSDDPTRRAKDLEEGHPFRVTVAAVFVDAGHLERGIHSKLKACRQLGGRGTEWFRTPMAAALRAVGGAMDAAPTTPPPLSPSSSSSSTSSSEAMEPAEGPIMSRMAACRMRRELDRGVSVRGNPLEPASAQMRLEKLSKRAARLAPRNQQPEMDRLNALADKWAAAGTPE